jgi:hypothetical protein
MQKQPGRFRSGRAGLKFFGKGQKMSAAATAAIAFNMMSESNNRREHEARLRQLREAEEKHLSEMFKRRAEVSKWVSKHGLPKHKPKTSDEIDGEIISSLPSKNGVIRLI